ncbi:MAG: hypothetical protein ACM3PT_06175 [Deltaproteobacteria bacterium]
MKTKNYLILILGIFLMSIFNGCQKEDYSLGELVAPSNLVISTEIAGKDANNPNGDGSGDVKISASANDALAYKIDFGISDTKNFVPMKNGVISFKYTTLGTKTYTISVIAYGSGGTATSASKTITVKFDYKPADFIISNLTGGSSKTWIVDKSVPGHFGVGPWDNREPVWWQAGVNEKVNCCNCFYTSTFTFTKSGNNYSLAVNCPDGAFTKTGSLTNLPGIPAAGDEACYPYAGGTNSISFLPTPSTNENTTNTIVKMGGNNIYIGYGALQDEYEILKIESNVMRLRIRGTETGNAWYLILIPKT